MLRRIAAAPLAAALLLALSGSAASKLGYLSYADYKGTDMVIEYNSRSILINATPSLFVSGSVHMPRIHPSLWKQTADAAVAHGMNMLEVYVFWNFHEAEEGKFNFEGPADLYKFIETLGDSGLWVNLRIGPYVCAEWEYGGIPAWLGLKPGVAFRTENTVWQTYMESFFTRITGVLEPLFATNGGPIILVQVENELQAGKSVAAHQYIEWCGHMANNVLAKYGAAVPVTMCNGDTASTAINTCNSEDCAGYLDIHGQTGRILVDQPALWTENEGGFQTWGGSANKPLSYFWGRSVTAHAFSVLRWFARGGSLMNYYMFIGGVHLGPTQGAGITQAYSYDVQMCPDSQPHEPKFSHFTKMHNTIADLAETLLASPLPRAVNVTATTGGDLFGKLFVFNSSRGCALFLENNNDTTNLSFALGSFQADVPFMSASVINCTNPDAYEELYNSAKVSTPTQHRVVKEAPQASVGRWTAWQEPKKTSGSPASFVPSALPPEQNSKTEARTQFLLYAKNVSLAQICRGRCPSRGRGGDNGDDDVQVTIQVTTTVANSMSFFLDGTHCGTASDRNHDGGEKEITLETGSSELEIMSMSLGNSNGMGAGSVGKKKGIVGPVFLNGLNITQDGWMTRVGLLGEANVSSIPFAAIANDTSRSGVWLQTSFVLARELNGTQQLLLDLTGLDIGIAYVNAVPIARYWLIPSNDPSGLPTQRYYSLPKAILNAAGQDNTLVAYEAGTYSDLTAVRVMMSEMEAGPPDNFQSTLREIASCEF